MEGFKNNLAQVFAYQDKTVCCMKELCPISKVKDLLTVSIFICNTTCQGCNSLMHWEFYNNSIQEFGIPKWRVAWKNYALAQVVVSILYATLRLPDCISLMQFSNSFQEFGISKMTRLVKELCFFPKSCILNAYMHPSIL